MYTTLNTNQELQHSQSELHFVSIPTTMLTPWKVGKIYRRSTIPFLFGFIVNLPLMAQPYNYKSTRAK